MRKSQLRLLIEAGRNPESTMCTQCGKHTVEPDRIEAHGIVWIIRVCADRRCGYRAVLQVPTVQIPAPRDVAD